MRWYAIEAVTDAVEATREFLFPFDLGRWARLAVIVFFLGGAGGGGGNGGGQMTSNATNGFGGGFSGIGSIQIPWWVWVLVFGVVVLALAFAFVSAVMRYVFVDALRTDAVEIVEPFGDRLVQGLTLFGFTVALFLLVAAPVVLLVGVFWLLGVPFIGVAIALPVIVVLGLVVAVGGGLTIDFVVPVSIAEDVGVVGGWRAFWPVLTAAWKQIGLYLVVKLVINTVIGIVVGLVVTVLAIPLALTGFVAGVVGFGGFGAIGALGFAAIALALVPLLVVFLLAVLLIRIPVVTYLTYFALLVLGDLEGDWDLIPERRAAIRADG